jgi:hypothetical protein
MPKRLREIDWDDVRIKRETFFQQLWMLFGMMMGAGAIFLFGIWGFIVASVAQLIIAMLFSWVYLRASDPFEKDE